MYTDLHRRRHPFGRVPVLQHGNFWLYETAAIGGYVSDAFDGPRLEPADARQRHGRCSRPLCPSNTRAAG